MKKWVGYCPFKKKNANWYIYIWFQVIQFPLLIIKHCKDQLPQMIFYFGLCYPDSFKTSRTPYRIRIRYGCRCGAHPILHLAYRSILTTLICPDMLWYVSDTSPIRSWYFFWRYFGGFGQEYTPDTHQYALILLWYVPEWNL
jgi:hypothetical protein